MRTAISFCCFVSVSGRWANHSIARRMEKSVTCEMSSVSSLTASASGFSRLPPQASQGLAEW